MIRVALLWHMHQPLYRNPVNGAYALPWTRLHALKDYYGMVKLAEEFPALRLTFNLVPSLMAQILDYADGRAQDPFFAAAAAPAEKLDEADRQFLLRYFFQAAEATIERFPRYAELLAKFRQDNCSPHHGARHFRVTELRDLQVLNQLAWVDDFWLEEEPARSLLRKGREFTRDDQRALCEAQQTWIGAVLPEYRRARDRGQIEISASAYYHPILPLLCDTEVAREAHPGVALPRQRFRFPQDAREQLTRARRMHAEVFGAEPRGLWPSEGSVSAEVAALAAGAGFAWMASDEGVLARSLGTTFERDEHGAIDGAELLYSGHRLETEQGPITLFFRDHRLSDLIGFVYSQLPAEQAAADFMQRIEAAAAPLTAAGRDAIVTIILDGENAWEYFPSSGRDFLRALYGRLTSTPGVTTCTFSEAAALPARPLARLAAGSRIDANFDIWIGHEEDNRAWDRLHAARLALAAREPESVPGYAAAYDDLLAAEGSDWNWWYGPQHHSENAPEFDSLFRALLSDAYAKLGHAPPAILAVPITHDVGLAALEPATGLIHPRIDGRVSSYFEWIGAALYRADPRTGAMHGKQFRISALHAGYDDAALYLRLDFSSPPQELEGELRCDISNERDHALAIRLAGGQIASCRLDGAEAPGLEAALHRILEVRVPRAPLELETRPSRLRLRVGYWKAGLPHEMLPAEGSLELVLQPANTVESY